MHCDTVISPEPTGITAVITIRYWLRCFGDRNQKRNLQPSRMDRGDRYQGWDLEYCLVSISSEFGGRADNSL